MVLHLGHAYKEIPPNCLYIIIHVQMKKLYSWHDVAKRTEIVYNRALKCSNQSLIERLPRYISCKDTSFHQGIG